MMSAEFNGQPVPEAFEPLFQAHMAAIFSPAGKRMRWSDIKVTINVIDSEKMLHEIQRLVTILKDEQQ